VAIDFKTRLHLTAAGIDFLLNHPKLKFVDVLAGVMILRQTILFGKLSDTMTLAQLSRGVRHLNRGTGCCRRRLSLAVATLAEAQFVRMDKAQSCWRGRTFTICCDDIVRAVEALRLPADAPSGELGASADSHRSELCRNRQAKPGAIASDPPEFASSESAAAMRRLIGRDDIAELTKTLNDMTLVLRVPLPAVSAATCRNLIADARRACPNATPVEITWFLRNKLVDSPTRFKTWGGAVFAVRSEFGRGRR
jgi:hypothetical protein